MQHRGTAWLRFFLFLLTVLVGSAAIWMAFTSHASFTSLVFSQIGQPAQLEKFRNTLLTPERFLTLQVLAATVALLLTGGTVYVWNRLPRLPTWWQAIRQLITQVISQSGWFWRNISRTERLAAGLLFLGIVASRLYFLFRFPFHIDERFTYLYFVSKGLGVSAAYYPNPNNHILFTLLCNVADIFTDDPWWVMKLPGLFTGLGLAFTFWLVVRYHFGAKTAFVATILFAFSESVFYYGTQGRGYSLLMLFVLISAFSAVQIARKPNAWIGYGGFWLSSTLGFYTLPIFLYPFAGNLLLLTGWMLTQWNWQTFRRIAGVALLTTGSVFILYLPVFLFNGWTAVSGNAWVLPLPWAEFAAAYPAHTLSLFTESWGGLPYGQWLTAGLLVYSLIVLFRSDKASVERIWAALWLGNVASLVGISLLQRLLLFQRVLLYLSVFQYLLLALLSVRLFRLLFKKAHFPAIMLACTVFVSIATYSLHRLTDPEKFDWYDSFDTTAQLLYQREADSLFVNYYEYSLCIRFLYETNGRAIQHMDVNQPVAGVSYLYLVLHKSRSFPPNISRARYRIIYSDPEVAVYKRR